nr:MAG TPA: CRM1 / Exportin repeat 3 [Caudoviricetes sp.]
MFSIKYAREQNHLCWSITMKLYYGQMIFRP